MKHLVVDGHPHYITYRVYNLTQFQCHKYKEIAMTTAVKLTLLKVILANSVHEKVVQQCLCLIESTTDIECV